MNLLSASAYFGVTVSILAYLIGDALKKKFKSPLLNPLLISIILVIAFLKVSNIDYDTYQASAKYLTYLLTPATVCLAIPLYEQIDILKHNGKAIFIGILAGVVASLTCVLVMAIIFGLSHAEYVTLLPKSVTSAIGLGISQELGGYTSLTVAIIIVTGIFGNVFAPLLSRLFGIRHPVAKGVAIGTSSHAIGTAKALEMGEMEGAISSLSIAVSGLLTVVGASIFAQFM